MIRSYLFGAALFVATVSCSSSSSDSTSVEVTISPAKTTTKILGKVTLTINHEVTENTANSTKLELATDPELVTWAITEGAAGGTLALHMVGSSYEYTAPNVPGTYHVVVTSKRDTSAKATSEITVTP